MKTFPDKKQIHDQLAALAQEYPPVEREWHMGDFERTAFHMVLAKQGIFPGGRIADIGGGLGLFSAACASLGTNFTVVDDFCDFTDLKAYEDTIKIYKRLNVELIKTDVISGRLEFPANSFDVITTFDSMEHWHNSPRKLFRHLVAALRPGGRFIIGVPNCVNLRKRVAVPLGYGRWSRLDEWYEKEHFRSHVREPTVADLHHIAADLGLSEISIFGRNWLGYRNPSGMIRALTPFVDWPLRLFPSLCSNIYIIGHKMAPTPLLDGNKSVGA